jgi:hypothetical protein
MESGFSGWTFTGQAQPVLGNEIFHVGGLTDHTALAIGPGGSVTTAPICIDDTYPWFRLFARNMAIDGSKLRVEVLYTDAKGRLRNQGTGDYESDSLLWQPTDTLDIDVDFDKTVSPTALVSFRFTSDNDSSWQIDDVYVDPMARG